MYLGIDIGGTKTLLACLNDSGVIKESLKFPTPQDYHEFPRILADTVAKLATKEFVACGVGVPGRLDRKNGIGLAMGNLPWKNVPVRDDVQRVTHCPVIIENDAKLACLSEAMLLKGRFNRVAYVTISTGIGVGIVVDQKIEPNLLDAEPGKMPLEHHGKIVPWESFASGKAIVQRYGKLAEQIKDDVTWHHIAHDIALGLIDVIAVVQPEVVVLGGSVATQFARFGEFLNEELHRYEVPLIPVPSVIPAARPEEAVAFGCYDLAKMTYGNARS